MKKKVKKKKVKIISTFPIRTVKAIFLMLPAAISFLWLVSLKLTQKTITVSAEGIMLAPPKNMQQLALVLLIFTVGYLLFLFLIFFSNIKKALDELMSRMKH